MFLQKSFRLFCVSLLFTVATSCSKTATEPLDEMVSTAGVLKYEGSFTGQGGQDVSGQVQIYLENNKYVLKLTNFKSDNGPDLKVYLSKAVSPQDHISLGDLKSTNGNQVYDIAGTTDVMQYPFVLIHCERFNHRYGSAELMK
jgi:hypothetical protein